MHFSGEWYRERSLGVRHAVEDLGHESRSDAVSVVKLVDTFATRSGFHCFKCFSCLSRALAGLTLTALALDQIPACRVS